MDIFDAEPRSPEENIDLAQAEVCVSASQEEVWAFVSEPGWWINDGPLGDHEVSVGEDGVYTVNDPDAGQWLVAKADEDPMDVVSFRWYPMAGDELPDDRATLVEVSLSDEDGRIVIHIEESGLASVSDDEAEARQVWEDEVGMWEATLLAVKEHLEA
ncbi:toxin [Actinomyces sp. B33]|uniref:toxin n=1 Tax=Actinomyces sp. B33 TaxID=2942131 RepID=UPI0023400488|nr:toxin [Actinomyces sp. B33]MDC4233906.1 toxin [Actinomyces sp. B33]